MHMAMQCPRCGLRYTADIYEVYRLTRQGRRLARYEVSGALSLEEHKRRIYECVRESVYDGMPKRELYRALRDVFGLSPDDAWGMLEELKDALGMYCPDGEHLRRVG